MKLNKTLTQLESYNQVYLDCPPNCDEEKEKFRIIQRNLTLRNDFVSDLLRGINKVAMKKEIVDSVAKDINDINAFCEKEFKCVDIVVCE